MRDLLLSPLAWMLFGGLLTASMLRLFPGRRWLVLAPVALIAFAILLMTPWFANRLAWRMERPVPADASCTSVPPSTVVVLAAGTDGRAKSPDDFTVLSATSRRRLDSGITYQREKPGRRMVLSGGPASVRQPPTAELLAAYARWHGVPAMSIEIEPRSRTTWENARFLAKRVGVPRRIALATSAMHMSRAQLAFAAAGFVVCPLPSDYRRLSVWLPWALIPRTSALATSEAVLHEVAGTVYYQWLRRRSVQP